MPLTALARLMSAQWLVFKTLTHYMRRPPLSFNARLTACRQSQPRRLCQPLFPFNVRSMARAKSLPHLMRRPSLSFNARFTSHRQNPCRIGCAGRSSRLMSAQWLVQKACPISCAGSSSLLRVRIMTGTEACPIVSMFALRSRIGDAIAAFLRTVMCFCDF